MTGMVRPTVTDTWELVVVCDRCGGSERAQGLEMRDFGVLWQAARSCGWLGPTAAARSTLLSWL